MKKIVVCCMLIAAGLVQAEEEPELPRPAKRPMEEVIVTGIDLSSTQGALLAGISGAYLIHEYDKDKNVWSFIRVSNKTKEE